MTTATTALLGKHELGKPAAPLNATSHILWGDDAAEHDQPDVAHTLIGAALNLAAMASWAVVLHGFFPRARSKAGAALRGVAVSAMAYVTDYHVVPKRLTPGFEKRLSSRALFTVYGALAAALGAGAALSGGRR